MHKLNSIHKRVSDRKLFLNNLNSNKHLSTKQLIKAPELSTISKVKSLKSKSSMEEVVKKRVEDISNLSKDVSGKYQIKEQEVYEKLYLKVRRLFLEAL